MILAEEGPLVARLESAGASVEVLPMDTAAQRLGRGGVRPGALPPAVVLATLAYTVRLAARLRELDPDLVHTNSLKAMFYGLAAGKLAGMRVVVHVRDRIAEDYLPTPAVRAVRLLCGRVADGVVANSAVTLATLPASCREAVVIPSPVDVARFSAGTERRSERPFTVAVVGRIAPWKGQDLFLRAFAEAFSDGDEVALVVGSALFGEDAFEAEVRALAEDLGIGQRVTFTGFRDDVADLLSEVDVLVHTSTIPEPFGQVVVQGMAAGLCVIASAEGGPATIVTDGVDGILCEPRDVQSYACAMRKVRSDPILRSDLGTKAKMTAQRFAPEVIAEEMLSLYERVRSSA